MEREVAVVGPPAERSKVDVGVDGLARRAALWSLAVLGGGGASIVVDGPSVGTISVGDRLEHDSVSLSVPLTHRRRDIGTMTVYWRAPVVIDDRTVRLALRLAQGVGAMLGRELDLTSARERVLQLEHALATRVVVEQAKGMVAAALHVSVEDALQLLRGFARSHQVRLHDVASDVVGGRFPVVVLRSS